MPTSSSETTSSIVGLADLPPSTKVAWVAAWVCPETERIGRSVGFPVAVVAATGDPSRHAARLATTEYAAWSPREWRGWVLPFDGGEAYGPDLAYRQIEFQPRWLGGAPLPDGVEIEDGRLKAHLPTGVEPSDLAALLRAGLGRMSFEHVVRRPDQVRYRYHTGREVVVPPRYALVRPRDIDHVVPAEDLYRFRPRDLSRVATVLARGVASLSAAKAADGRSTIPVPAPR